MRERRVMNKGSWWGGPQAVHRKTAQTDTPRLLKGGHRLEE